LIIFLVSTRFLSHLICSSLARSGLAPLAKPNTAVNVEEETTFSKEKVFLSFFFLVRIWPEILFRSLDKWEQIGERVPCGTDSSRRRSTSHDVIAKKPNLWNLSKKRPF
jgi:hypothetical protein